MANIVYTTFKKQLLNAGINFGTSTMKVMLVTSTYTPNQDTHAFRSDVTNEVSGVGYSAGGTTLANGTVTQDNTNHLAAYSADNITWGTATITARAAVLYKSTGVAASDPLVGYFDFGADQISSSGNFTVQWGTAGIINLT